MKTTSLALLLLAILSASSAQPPDTLWTRMFATEMGAAAYGVAQTQDGGFAVVGEYQFLYHQSYNGMYALRTDAAGNRIWDHEYDHEFFPRSRFYGVRATRDGGFIACGNDQNTSAPGTLVKLDSAGNVEWAQTYGNEARAVLTLDEGGYVACGLAPFSVFKTDDTGRVQWSVSLPAYLVSITVVADGYVATGFVSESSQSFVYVVKVNLAGDTLWTRTVGRTSHNLAYAVCSTPDDNILLAGETGHSDTSDIYLIKMTNSGDTLWTRTIGDSTQNYARDIIPVRGGGYVMACQLGASQWVSRYRLAVMKIDENGGEVWRREVLGSPDWTLGEALCVRQTMDGGFVVAGRFDLTMALVRLDRDLTVPQSQPILADDYGLFVFPNPFNPSATLSFALPRAAHATLTVYDVTGREVQVMHDGFFDAGEHNFTFNGSALPTGLYFARLQSGANVATQKLLLLK